MIDDQLLAREYVSVAQRFYPKAGKVLSYCYVRIISSHLRNSAKRLRYVGIYCASDRLTEVDAQKDVLREIATNMGLVDVVCMNATRLIRDPMSKLKRDDPRFWLELHWVATEMTEKY